MAFDARRQLEDGEIETLKRIAAAVCFEVDDTKVVEVLRAEFAAEPDSAFLVLQVVGLTRNKIITDLKALTAGAGVSIPGDARQLYRYPKAWDLAGAYLTMRLRMVFVPLCQETDLDGALEALNQATWPGWIRQERAKRQGHEAEGRLAIVLADLGIPFEPAGKAENPLTSDAQVHGVSFDLVVPNAENPLVGIKATVHTSNIGQYGESKDHLEVTEAMAMFEEQFDADKRPQLIAFIDGVGFRSNRAGLGGVLSNADEFCQFKTLWKVPIVAAARLGLTIELYLPEGETEAAAAFLERYGDHVTIVDKPYIDARGRDEFTTAGIGLVRLR
jgi:hypothetical protein